MYYECKQSHEKDPFTLDKFAGRDLAVELAKLARDSRRRRNNFAHNSHIREGRYLHKFKSHIR